MKVFFPTNGAGVGAMFEERENEDWEITEDWQEADLFQFVGGADVNPLLYNATFVHEQTHYNTFRDLAEIGWWRLANLHNIPCAGICRGGQFLNVMNGGSMLQHIETGLHTRSHYMNLTKKGQAVFGGLGLPEKVAVTSTHHQMMQPDYRFGDVVYEADHDQGVEVVRYWETKTLCFQPHPEYVRKSLMEDLYFRLLNELITEPY